MSTSQHDGCVEWLALLSDGNGGPIPRTIVDRILLMVSKRDSEIWRLETEIRRIRRAAGSLEQDPVSLLDHAPPCPDCGTALVTVGDEDTSAQCPSCGYDIFASAATWDALAQHDHLIGALVAEVRRLREELDATMAKHRGDN